MRYKHLFSNAWLISLIPFVVIVFFVPINTNKYNLTLLRTNLVSPGQYVFYDDLDNDGTSERMIASDQSNATSVSISNKSGIIDQWNFGGSFSLDLKKSIVLTGDKDNDGKKEVYVFTLKSDSIFLHCISDLNNSVPGLKNRFISVVGKGIKNPDPTIVPTDMYDIDSDGTKEFIFGINTGISHSPRKLFAYYIDRDSLVSSPETGYFIMDIMQADINKDGYNEFLPWGYAACNIEPQKSRYHDYNSFLLAFDKDLRFIFEPVKFGGEFSFVSPFILYGERDLIGCLYLSRNIESNSIIYKTDSHGNKTDSIPLSISTYNIRNVQNEQYFLPLVRGGYALYDRNFRLVRKINFNSSGAFHIMDIDGDNREEYIMYVPDEGKLYIYREGLKHPVSLKLAIATAGWDILTLRKGYGTASALSIQTGQTHYLAEYKENPYYYFSWLIYPGLYFAVFLFTYSLISVSRNQLRRWYENEKKVSELQLALVRNQLEPHFILNAINSIIYSVSFGEKDQASDSLRCFSSMYRDLVLSAGESRRSIENELAFCENYLTLEKMRFGDKFDYDVKVSETVDLKKFIPKFLIQIHAENAVKHGLAPLESGGLLTIDLKNDKNDLAIEITDNGIGREKSSEVDKGTTGKGLATMNELYSLYSKLYNEKITSEFSDLFDENNKPAGTKVIIRIISQE